MGLRDYFLRLHTPFSIVDLARQPYLLNGNDKSGRILIRSSLSSDSLVRVRLGLRVRVRVRVRVRCRNMSRE